MSACWTSPLPPADVPPIPGKGTFLSFFSPPRIRSKNREKAKCHARPKVALQEEEKAKILLKDACVRAWVAYRLLWCQSLPW
ncbi:hypothetical protein TNCT_216181 [Trichonephila clavata]|uniref:Uncharacterized protein n=1 Tax=Trichonephila clavata TaxID=2740835 RepID=A0A8X6H5Y5_TRICU|nr:hypothetical protein TNCT_216181 [Trichonephila clavata]